MTPKWNYEIKPATIDDSAEILALQKLAYMSEAEQISTQ